MQRFEELQLEDGTVLKNSKPIEKYLYTSAFSWLLECELDNVKLSINDGILYWKSGIFYWGISKWMVFESGEFRSGTFTGGIWLGGTFKGIWKNGVWKKGEFKGERIAGKFPDEKIT